MKEMKEMKEVAIFLSTLREYRVPIYNELAESYSVTVFCSAYDAKFEGEINFKIKIINQVKLGPFIFHKLSSVKLNRFDVIINQFNLRCIDSMFMSVNPFLHPKIIYWGIGVTASYTKGFNQKSYTKFFRDFFGRRASSLIVYSDRAKDILSKTINQKKIFVANNTIKNNALNPYFSHCERDSIIFIGSLYKEKGLDELIESYNKLINIEKKSLHVLKVIGDGDEVYKAFLKKKVLSYKLEQHVIFIGGVYQDEQLCPLFNKALACISPKQAGLSVLKSMSFGVPFITTKDAITGGEIFNIMDNNGVVMNDISEMDQILLSIYECPEIYLEMGRHANEYYLSNCTPSIMVNGVTQAIEYVLN